MTTERIAIDPYVKQLFLACGLTLALRDREVLLIADTHEDADAVYEWLKNIAKERRDDDE